MDKKLSISILLGILIVVGIYLIYLNSTVPSSFECGALEGGDYNDYLVCHNNFMSKSIPAQTIEGALVLLVIFVLPLLSIFLFYENDMKLISVGRGILWGGSFAFLFNIYDSYLRSMNYFGRGDLSLSILGNFLFGIVLILFLIIGLIFYLIGKKKIQS